MSDDCRPAYPAAIFPGPASETYLSNDVPLLNEISIICQ